MSTIHLNDSHFNSSLDNKCRLLNDNTVVGLSLVSVALISNFVVSLPVNVWVVWLICHKPKEVLSSEIYLLSLSVCEIINCLGLPAQLHCMYSFEMLSDELALSLTVLWMLGWVGRPMFQSCICVERYLAVVHPLVFIRFKPLKYKMAPCALICCVLFLNVYLMLKIPAEINVALVWFLPTLCVFLYCYLLVLCSLKRRGPGEREGNERRGDKIKERAFNIILVHLACFFLSYFALLILSYLTKQMYIPGIIIDLFLYVGTLFGLVQPFLYLHKAGKLSCIREHRPEG